MLTCRSEAVIDNVTDEGAAIIQIKENQGLTICDYSKLLENHKITQKSLANNINASRAKLTQFLTFNKVPKAIWGTLLVICPKYPQELLLLYTHYLKKVSM